MAAITGCPGLKVSTSSLSISASAAPSAVSSRNGHVAVSCSHVLAGRDDFWGTSLDVSSATSGPRSRTHFTHHLAQRIQSGRGSSNIIAVAQGAEHEKLSNSKVCRDWEGKAQDSDEFERHAAECLNSGKSRTNSYPLERVDWIEEGRDECQHGRDGRNVSPSSSSQFPFTLFSAAPMLVYPLIADGPGYSLSSYYTSLGLFVISVPGIWSLVKRSTKSKIVKKTFALPGPSVADGKAPNQIAGEITSSLTRNNFTISDRGETVTFEGLMVPSRGQAAFLSFCTAVSLGCVGLVLSITVPEVGANWYYLTVLSPLAGFYYWTRASRKEQIKVKMVIADDDSSTDVIIQGDDEQIDRLRRELGLMEKGMVYVKGVLER